jgi:hypothetical protein
MDSLHKSRIYTISSALPAPDNRVALNAMAVPRLRLPSNNRETGFDESSSKQGFITLH